MLSSETVWRLLQTQKIPQGPLLVLYIGFFQITEHIGLGTIPVEDHIGLGTISLEHFFLP